MKVLHVIAFVLVVIGGINWLLIGINPSWDLVQILLSWGREWLPRLVYILVGLSALLLIFTHKASCNYCTRNTAPQM